MREELVKQQSWEEHKLSPRHLEEGKMTKQEEGFDRKFDRCPGCGSEERYFEGILKGLQDRGLLEKKIECFDFQLQQGLALPEAKILTLPFGSEIPAFKRIWDTCCNCGLVYSTHLSTTTVKKSLEVAQQTNREQRRHLGQAFGRPPGSIIRN